MEGLCQRLIRWGLLEYKNACLAAVTGRLLFYRNCSLCVVMTCLAVDGMSTPDI